VVGCWDCPIEESLQKLLTYYILRETKEMTYTEITEEQEEQIKALFYVGGYRDTEFTFKTKDDGYYIEARQMYDYLSFTEGISVLQGYLRIADILGCDNGDEYERYSSSGCETCDYGSSYEWTLKFWRS